MKSFKLISSGANGKLYYAMNSALDKLKEVLEFADRVYIIDEGKNYIWTGSELVEDKNPSDSDSGSGGSGESIIHFSGFGENLSCNVDYTALTDELLTHSVVTLDDPIYNGVSGYCVGIKFNERNGMFYFTFINISSYNLYETVITYGPNSIELSQNEYSLATDLN